MDDSNITAHELLQDIYRNEEAPLTVRMRAAIESLPYETPKLMAVAHFSGNFAEQLDKAIEQRTMKLIEAKPIEQHDASELKGNMPKLRRRI